MFGGKPKRVLEMAIDGEIEVAISDPIIQEVRRHLLGKFGWAEPRAAAAVEKIADFATHVTPTETIDTVATDPDDNRVGALRGAESAPFVIRPLGVGFLDPGEHPVAD